ncbi:M23 family metallopeptidase [Terricaulis silvestris]|uniref:Murein hydrolase activator NlpD n=1 Tax=Terricaulis silvestris TaxID=2686094 RepID=A0A6I6MW62_9CAUL|nr:M23 family metallopeptidase [Terricaulis silvestris]QGZ95423.1 Murein hydrolase activator NlpD precursor [Terricaulis silvestris]
MMRGSLLLALLATACASGQAAPIAYGGGAQPPVAAPPPVRQAPRPVVEQETPSAPIAQEAPNWADGEGTALSAYALQPNEAQPFDPAHLPRAHRVRANESLYDVATTYQVPLRALIDQNRLEPPYALRPGSELQLPPPRFHTVARGESFEDVARRYNVDTRSLALLNRMQAPYRVRQGDRIVLPAMARSMEIASVSPAPPPASAANAGEAPAVQTNARFAWPLRGQLVTRYGAQPDGARIDGVEIAGREGAQISAAAEGDVVYAGSDLAAYGTLVLVRHADNYVTAYGHARRALVREGQHVRAGEAIAELGPRSDGRPRLLFQVRRGAEAIDPTPLLGP